MGCDHTRFWDVYFGSHEHSMSLLDSSLPRATVLTALKAEVTSRVQLENKMQRFVRLHQSAFFGFFNGHQEVSEQSFHGYHNRNKKATHGFVASAMRSVAQLDAAHAMSILGTELFVKYAQSLEVSDVLSGRRRRRRRKNIGKWAKKKVDKAKNLAKKYGQAAVDVVKNMDAGVSGRGVEQDPWPCQGQFGKICRKGMGCSS